MAKGNLPQVKIIRQLTVTKTLIIEFRINKYNV